MTMLNDQLGDKKLDELHHKEEEALVRTLAPQHGYQYINLADITISPGALHLIPETTARSAEIVGFNIVGNTLSVAFRNPNNPLVHQVLEELKAKKYDLKLYMASKDSIDRTLIRYSDTKHTVAEKKGVLDINPEAIAEFAEKIHAPEDVEQFVRKLRAENSAERVSETIELTLGGALALGASDVHIEPEKKTVRVRYRLDGVLWDITDIEQHIYNLYISRLKLLSGLKLNVRNEAQDGRFTFTLGDRAVEVRSSIIPGAQGESMVMRLLDPDASSFKIESLGISEKLAGVIKKELERPHGAFITTGPTGSGKTTALYAFLQSIHKPEVKIITIEDPVEYKLPGVVQTQVSEDYSFASGLRAVLRQDPDVIMVGEIRDREVAETAVHAALTGHLVFSTLHTNSAVGAFPRLIDIGIDSRMIGSAFNIILGQRLVRRLCEHCKEKRDATTEEQTIIARIMNQPVAMQEIWDAPGCDKCANSRFKGRIGIYEAVVVDKAVEEAVVRDPREVNILEAAKPQDIPNMQQDGILKVLAGITSIDEVQRVVDLHNIEGMPEKKEGPLEGALEPFQGESAPAETPQGEEVVDLSKYIVE